MKQASSIRGDRYNFNVYINNGELKPDLKRSFLRVINISWDETHVMLEDATKWELYIEQQVIDMMRVQQEVKCVVSFQVFRNTEQIAIARMYRPRVSQVTDNIVKAQDRNKEGFNHG